MAVIINKTNKQKHTFWIFNSVSFQGYFRFCLLFVSITFSWLRISLGNISGNTLFISFFTILGWRISMESLARVIVNRLYNVKKKCEENDKKELQEKFSIIWQYWFFFVFYLQLVGTYSSALFFYSLVYVLKFDIYGIFAH